MTTIELKYDAFNIKTTLTVNGTEQSLRCFGTGRETLLREWIGSFFPELIKFCNLGPGAECEVQFYGTLSDYEDVKSAYNGFILSNKDININLHPCKCYPQAVDEVMAIIIKNIAGLEENIAIKRDAIQKLSSGNSDNGNQQWTQKIKQDKERFRHLARENLSEIEGVINAKKETIFSLSTNSGPLAKEHDTNWKSRYNYAGTVINDLFLKIHGEISEEITMLVKNHVEAYQALYQKQFQEYTALYKKASEIPEIERYSISDFCKKIPFNKPWLEILKTANIPETTIIGEALQIQTIKKAVLESQNELKTFFEKASNNLRDKESEIRAYYEAELQKLYALVQDNITVLENEIAKIESALQAFNDLNVEIDTFLTGHDGGKSD